MAEMTSVERCQTVLDVGIPDRVPVCLLNFMPALLRVGSVGFLGLAGGAAACVRASGRSPTGVRGAPPGHPVSDGNRRSQLPWERR
jgi:hypothetical protein